MKHRLLFILAALTWALSIAGLRIVPPDVEMEAVRIPFGDREIAGLYVRPELPGDRGEIEFQPGNAVAWYVEASNSADIPGTDYRRIDSSAVRFINPFPAAACDYTPTDWCATP